MIAFCLLTKGSVCTKSLLNLISVSKYELLEHDKDFLCELKQFCKKCSKRVVFSKKNVKNIFVFKISANSSDSNRKIKVLHTKT